MLAEQQMDKENREESENSVPHIHFTLTLIILHAKNIMNNHKGDEVLVLVAGDFFSGTNV